MALLFWTLKVLFAPAAPNGNASSARLQPVHKGHSTSEKQTLIIQGTQYTLTASALCDAIKTILNRGEHRGRHS